jgi:N4-gp56 family major capsid protein
MSGQLWSRSDSGYMATPTLSEELRTAVQPLSRFTQFCDVEVALGKNKGDEYTWNIYGDTADDGNAAGIPENQRMPETDFPVGNGRVVVKEFGISVPYSGKYDDLSEHPVKEIIHKTLKNNANKTLDRVAHNQFNATLLRATATSATAFDLVDTGTAGGNHTHALSLDHIKAIGDEMEERNIPVFDGENYVMIARPSTLRPMRNELEDIHKYTSEGWMQIMNGEKGKYENFRVVSQTNVSSAGWANSDAAYFFGADTVTEVVACPLELRGKIPEDYGRSKGIAWYYLGNFGITHADATNAATKAQARIIKWDSVA